MYKTKVLLAEDHSVVRAGLRSILLADGGIEVVGEASDGVEAVALARRLMPDIAIIDIVMPRMDGLKATREITSSVKFTRVLILSSFCREDYVQRAVEAGAMGYVTKNSAAMDLLTAVHEVDKGNAFFCSTATKRLLDHCRESVGKTNVAPGEPKMDLTVTENSEQEEAEVYARMEQVSLLAAASKETLSAQSVFQP